MVHRKWWLATAGVLVLAAVFSSSVACSVFGIRRWEEYGHRVVLQEGPFEVRDYDSCIVATTHMTGRMADVSGASFNRLGGYIFGKNTARNEIAMTMPVIRKQSEPGQEIAMTVPVTRSATADGWTMSFIMPDEYDLDALPTPQDSQVYLEPRPAVTWAVYRYSGTQSEDDVARYGSRLREWALSKGYRVRSAALLAAYDPPWTIPFLRRNEVLIEVERLARSTKPIEHRVDDCSG